MECQFVVYLRAHHLTIGRTVAAFRRPQEAARIEVGEQCRDRRR